MIPVLSSKAIRNADNETIEHFGIPGFTLMESAGRACVTAIAREFGPLSGKHVACLCGKGNNGGDGLVIARLLYDRCRRVSVYLVGSADSLPQDAKLNHRLLERLLRQSTESRLVMKQVRDVSDIEDEPLADIYVDALLGTGINAALRPPYSDVADFVNQTGRTVVSVDMPTGINTDTGMASGSAVRADLTITMAALKPGLLLNDGPQHAGIVNVAEIGIPSFILRDQVLETGSAALLDDDDVVAMLPARDHRAHKHNVGRVLVVGGSAGLTGAPVMAAVAAARIGAGAVTCACPASVQPILASKMTEVMTLGLPESASGIEPREAMLTIEPMLEKTDVVLIGCGAGRSQSSQKFIHELLKRVNTLPVVLDADGLNAVAGHTELIGSNNGVLRIITPHVGEFRRLCGTNVDVEDRITLARTYAARWRCVLVLKGLPSVVGVPDGRVFVNGTGNPALATAGSGDVLAGMCAGLVGQGLSPADAAIAATHIGGAAADAYVQTKSGTAMVAMDLVDLLPSVLNARFSS